LNSVCFTTKSFAFLLGTVSPDMFGKMFSFLTYCSSCMLCCYIWWYY